MRWRNQVGVTMLREWETPLAPLYTRLQVKRTKTVQRIPE